MSEAKSQSQKPKPSNAPRRTKKLSLEDIFFSTRKDGKDQILFNFVEACMEGKAVLVVAPKVIECASEGDVKFDHQMSQIPISVLFAFQKLQTLVEQTLRVMAKREAWPVSKDFKEIWRLNTPSLEAIKVRIACNGQSLGRGYSKSKWAAELLNEGGLYVLNLASADED